MIYRKIFSYLTIAIAFVFVAGAQAQQEDEAALFDVNMKADIYVPIGSYSGGGYVYFNDEQGAGVGGSIGGPHGNTYTIGPSNAKVIPGKDYVVSVQYGTYNIDMGVEFDCPNKGYHFVINGERKSRIEYNGSAQTTFTFRLEYNGSYPLEDAPSGLAGGIASQIVSDKPIWYLGLGSMRNGDSAGAIGFRELDFSDPNFFTPNILNCDNRDASEIYIAKPSGYIQQVYAREVLINVAALNSTSYQLKVYPRSQVGSKSGSFYSVSGSPFVTYTISKYTVSGGTGVKILKVEDGSTWETKLQRVTNGSGHKIWTHWPWAVQSSSLARYTTTTHSSETNTTVAHSGTNSQGTGVETPIQWSKVYSQNSWGKELASETFGSGNDLQVVNQFSYYNTSSSSGGKVQGYLESETFGDGSWKRYEYFTDSGRRGKLKRLYTPWENGTASPASATTSNSSYEDWTYTNDQYGNLTAPASRISYSPGGSILSKTVWTYDYYEPNLNGKAVKREIRKDYSSSSSYLQTITKRFKSSSNRYFSEQPISISRPDGSFDSFAYFNGTWNPSSNTFTASGGGEDRQVMIFHGQDTGGTSISSVTLNGVTWYIDPVHMVSKKSIVSVSVVDARGKIMYMGEELFVSSTERAQTKGVAYQYDSHGRLAKQIDVMKSDSADTFEKVYSYSAGLLSSVKDFDGLTTTYEYDSLLRRKKTTSGSGYSDSNFPAKVEETKFDGAGRPVQTFDCDCGTNPKLIAYDSAGRVLYESVASPNAGQDLLTSYDYDTVTRTITTLENGADVTQDTYFDGRPKAIFGDVAAPRSFDYSANGIGELVTVYNTSNFSSAYGWVKEQRDWLGRLVSRTVPTYGLSTDSSKTVTTHFVYNGKGQLWKERVEYDKTGAYVRADKVYEYDLDGSLLKEGLDLNGNGSLDDSSNDRFVKHTTTAVDNASVGWMIIEDKFAYPTSNSSTSKRFKRYNYRVKSGSTSLGFVYKPDQVLDVNNRYVSTFSYVDDTNRKRQDYSVTKGSDWRFDEYRNGYLYESNGDAGEKSRFSYDSLGRQNKVQGRWNGSSFAETTNITYYSDTDFVKTTETGGITSTFSYAWSTSAKTMTEIVTDELGKKVYTLHNAKGQVWRVWGSATQPVEYEYDGVGRMTKMKTYRSGSFTGSSWPSSGIVAAVTTWDWEEATGLLLSKTSADGESVSFSYKPLGEVQTKTLARGVVSTYSYYDEAAGTSSSHVSHLTRELRQIDYTNDSNLTPSVRYSYNRLGQIASVITDYDSDGSFEASETKTFSYRSDMQLNSEVLESSIFGSSRSIVSTYESDGTNTVNGRLNGFQFKYGSTVQASATYGFDGTNRLVTAAPLSGQAMHLQYTAGSRWVGQVTAGPDVSGVKYKRTNTLLSNRFVVDQVNTTWSGSSRGAYDSNFDTQRGLRSAVVQSGASSSSAVITNFTTTLSYNDRRELIDADNSYSSSRDFEWNYDLMGKRTSAKVNTSTTTYNAVSSASTDVNEYASVTGYNGESGLLYDDDGNMERDGTWDYLYDAENRLVKMTRKTESSNSTIADRLEFKYDYLGRRVQKAVYNHRTSGSLLSKTSFVWNGWSLVAELNAASSHSLLRSYLWGPDFSTPSGHAGGAGGLLSVSQGAVVYYPVYDPMGNVTGYVTDNTSGTGNGAIAARYEYNAYGERQNGSGNENGFAFGFATQYTDRETGLVYYGMRYYNPKHGRFINRDPIGEQGGLNLYSFVGNNPAMWHDVLGLSVQCEEYEFVAVLIDTEEVDGKTLYTYQIGTRCTKWSEVDDDFDGFVLAPFEVRADGSNSARSYDPIADYQQYQDITRTNQARSPQRISQLSRKTVNKTLYYKRNPGSGYEYGYAEVEYTETRYSDGDVIVSNLQWAEGGDPDSGSKDGTDVLEFAGFAGNVPFTNLTVSVGVLNVTHELYLNPMEKFVVTREDGTQFVRRTYNIATNTTAEWGNLGVTSGGPAVRGRGAAQLPHGLKTEEINRIHFITVDGQ